MTRNQIIIDLFGATVADAGPAQSNWAPQTPEYLKTHAELAAMGATGGPGGSGNAKTPDFILEECDRSPTKVAA